MTKPKRTKAAKASHGNEEYIRARKAMFVAIDEFLVLHYGKRCRTLCSGCPTCGAWTIRDAMNAVIVE